MSKLTMEDIRKALEIINRDMPKNKVIKTVFGYVEVNYLGNPVKIQLDEDVAKEYTEIMKQSMIIQSNAQVVNDNVVVGEIYGIPVVVTEELKDELDK